jgi:POT family proton-dependent oligopeptide transporter
MTLGLIQYVYGWKFLGSAGLHPETAASPVEFAKAKRQAVTYIGIGAAVIAVIAILVASGTVVLTANLVTIAFSTLLLTVTIALFTSLFRRAEWTTIERGRLVMIGVYFLAAMLFWSVFEQAGSTLNLFARDFTVGDGERINVGPLIGEFPIVWWQSLNAVLIVLIAPLYAWMWVSLGRRQPSTPTKFAIGLIGVGLGFLWLVPAANITLTGVKVGVVWLFGVYFIHTLAELFLSPVGLSAMTKLAPPKIISLVMGIWFLGASVGNFLGGQAASFYETLSLPTLLAAVSVLPILMGVVMLIFRKKLTELQGGIS